MGRLDLSVKQYQELVAWQKAMDFAVSVCAMVKEFPKDEIFGLVSQLRRAAVSVPSNIAEGQGRRTTKDFIHFLYTAYGSLQEAETQLIIALRLGYVSPNRVECLLEQAGEIGRLINGLIRSLMSRTD